MSTRSDGPRPDDAGEPPLAPHEAAALAAATVDRTRRSLRISRSLVYGTWGVAWLAGLGGLWLGVRGQRPYRGPEATHVLLLDVLIALALAVTVADVVRSSRGVSGPSRTQQAMYGWAWALGFAGFFAVVAALSRGGADVRTIGTLAAVGPVLVTALVYVAGAALWADRVMFGLGVWLTAVGGAGAFAGPVGSLLAGAIGGGGAFLLVAAATEVSRRRTDRRWGAG